MPDVTMFKAKKPKFDKKRTEEILKKENLFIRNLCGILSLPKNNLDPENTELQNAISKRPNAISKTTRAKSLVELQARIDKLKNKNNINYREKLQKKNLKSRLNKKLKRETRNKQSKIKPEEPVKLESGDIKNPVKKDKMVFSKIDFEGIGKQRKKKIEKDPKKLLEKVQEVNEKVAQLKSIGEADKAVEIKEKTAWKNALAKAEGVKIKDDPLLLKKSIKKLEQKKKSSKKKWEARMENVQKAKDEKQKKRTENIEKRKKEKKVNKLKKAAKKGKIIPGF